MRSVVPPPAPSSTASSPSAFRHIHVGPAFRAARVVAAGTSEAVTALLTADTSTATTTTTTSVCTASATSSPSGATTVATTTITLGSVALIHACTGTAVPACGVPRSGEASCAEGAVGAEARCAAEASTPGGTRLVGRGQ